MGIRKVPTKCDYCGQMYPTLGARNTHRVRHEGEPDPTSEPPTDTYPWPRGGYLSTRRIIAQIYFALKLGGPIEDRSGLASGQLIKRLDVYGAPIDQSRHNLLAHLGAMERDGLIERSMNSRRTHYLAALPGGPVIDPFRFPAS